MEAAAVGCVPALCSMGGLWILGTMLSLGRTNGQAAGTIPARHAMALALTAPPAALLSAPLQHAAYVLTALSTISGVPAHTRPSLGAVQVGPACREQEVSHY